MGYGGEFEWSDAHIADTLHIGDVVMVTIFCFCIWDALVTSACALLCETETRKLHLFT